MDSVALLRELIAIPGPAGQESLVRDALASHVEAMGYAHETDAKGNFLVQIGEGAIDLVVTAHMDEIAMIVRRIEPDGRIVVASLGGLFPWKIGEGPVEILASEPISGILSFGSIHTEDPSSTVRKLDTSALKWDMARVFTGLTVEQLEDCGVRPGTRVVVARSRRKLTNVNDLVAGYFLDDRADLVSWLLALEELQEHDVNALFVATAAEEVGGEGALFLLHELRPSICIALELGPNVPDAPVKITDQPTVWANDGYSAMSAADGDLVARIGRDLGMNLQFQALSRGGSDASCAAGHGLCARPITLGLAMENSHGYEIMHPRAMDNLARLTVALVKELA
ncbi:M20/M25/M40 family metallo-hydrolase [soil metagenome]